jgi:riboflavin kinase/FMN adenylyltransferase
MKTRPRIFRNLSDVPSDFGPCATTIGNFDGVHVGHQTLIWNTVEIARARKWKAAVLTFNPHPAKIVAPDRAPGLIMTLDQRAEVMGSIGIDEVLMLPFTAEVSHWTPEEFVKTVLVDAMKVRAVLVGQDFRFGHKQAGDTALLTELGVKYGFEVDPIAAVNVRRERVSSSLIRETVRGGHLNQSRRFLGRPFSLEGTVIKGHGIGSKQTVPTLNLQPSTEVWPADGVYVSRTRDLDSDRVWKSITNIGNRPTFNGEETSIETFLLEPLTGQSPERLRVEFLWRVRQERKFANAAELKAQILRDVAVAQKYFQRVSRKR